MRAAQELLAGHMRPVGRRLPTSVLKGQSLSVHFINHLIPKIIFTGLLWLTRTFSRSKLNHTYEIGIYPILFNSMFSTSDLTSAICSSKMPKSWQCLISYISHLGFLNITHEEYIHIINSDITKNRQIQCSKGTSSNFVLT